MVAMVPLGMGSHKGSEEHHVASENVPPETVGHTIRVAPFQVFLHEGTGTVEEGSQSRVRVNAALQTVVDAFSHMMDHRTTTPDFRTL